MGDSENTLPPSKKRAAVRELSRDNPGLDDEEDSAELESGTFKRASDEVLAGRRIVKVRRKESSATPSSNPFAAIQLVPSTKPTGIPAETNAPKVQPEASSAEVSDEVIAAGGKTVSGDEKSDAAKETDEGKDKNAVATDVKNDAEAETGKGEAEKEVAGKVENAAPEGTDKVQEENSNQFGKTVDEPVTDSAVEKESSDVKENTDTVNETNQTGRDDRKESEGGGTENEEKKDNGSETAEKSADGAPLTSFQQHSSTKNAFTGLAGTGFSGSSSSFGSASLDGSSGSGFSFGLANNGNSSLFGSSSASIVSKNEGTGFKQMQEVPLETGEENERVAFSADSVLFEFLDGAWKERGKGELKVNVSTTGTGKARLLMRARGNYRLILNASLYAEMKLTNMDKKGVTFACVNSVSEEKGGLSTFAVKFKDASIVEVFRAAVMENKESKTEAAALKTPENSP